MTSSVDQVGTIEACAAAIRDRRISSVELTSALLERADELNHLGVYLARLDGSALAAAKLADEELASGLDRGLLHGVPIAIKDIISTIDAPTTAQSSVLDSAWGKATGDALCVRLLRSAGAVIIGKTTTMEFAAGMFDPEKPFPIPQNPWSKDRFPGGSSSGNAVGLASGMFPGALGSDTGGSIRCPAAFCGITGLKPTYGLVSKAGCVPVAFSLDHIGPMSRSARGCAAILHAVKGFDPADRCSVIAPEPKGPPVVAGRLNGVRIGIERRNHTDVSSEVARAFDDAASTLGMLGASLVEVVVPHYDELAIAAEVISRSELSAYHRETLMSKWLEYGSSMRQVVLPGFMYTGADYVQSQRLRSIGQEHLFNIFTNVDLIITPTARRGAPPSDGISRGGLKRELMTAVWNLLGNPALALPMGVDRNGLPLSLQIVGRPFEDEFVLQVGEAYQRVTDWHRREPVAFGSESDHPSAGQVSAGQIQANGDQ